MSATVDLITSTHSNVNRDALRFAAATFYQKLKAADGYVPATRYHGNVTLLRAKASSDYGDHLGGDYKLSEVRRTRRRRVVMRCGRCNSHQYHLKSTF